MALHSTLTGSDLHEPKGIEAASSGTTYIANGTGSGSWSKIASGNIDTSSIFTTNKFLLTYKIESVAAATDVYIPVPHNCQLNAVYAAISGTITTTALVFTVYNGVSSLGTITIAAASIAGTAGSLTGLTSNFTTGGVVRVASGGTTGAVNGVVTLELTWTA